MGVLESTFRMSKSTTKNVNIKQAAHQLLNELPDNVTWEEVAYHFAVRCSIEKGLADSEAGSLISTEDMLKEFGLPE